MTNKHYHIVGTVSKSNRKIVEGDNTDNLNTEIHDRPPSWLDVRTPIHDRPPSWLDVRTPIHDRSPSWLDVRTSKKMAAGGLQ